MVDSDRDVGQSGGDRADEPLPDPRSGWWEGDEGNAADGRDARADASSSDYGTADGGEPIGPPPPLPLLPLRISRIVLEPGEFFALLARNPRAWGAIFFGAALMALSFFFIPGEVWLESMRAQTAASGQEMPPEAMEMASRFGRIMAVVGVFIGIPVTTLISAGILTLVFRFGMAYEGSYRQYLAVVAHANLITAAGFLLLTPLRIAARNPQLTLGPRAFLPDLSGFFGRFLQSIDLFNLWAFALIGLGIAIVDGTRSPRTAMMVTLGIALVFALIPAVLGGLGPR